MLGEAILSIDKPKRAKNLTGTKVESGSIILGYIRETNKWLIRCIDCYSEYSRHTHQVTRGCAEYCEKCSKIKGRKKLNDLTGRVLKSGSKVIKRIGKTNSNNYKWSIECIQCNKEYTRITSHIKNGEAEYCYSCKMTISAKEKIDLVGSTFGKGCKVLEEIQHVQGSSRKYKVQCHCKHIWLVSQGQIRCNDATHECKTCAYKTAGQKQSGKNHWNYNQELTDKDRLENRRHGWNRKIIEEAKKRDGYKCVLCTSGDKIVAHHLDGWNWCKEKRFDVNNLITLCEICHDHFHEMFGRGDNTKEQFVQFKNKLFVAH